MQQRNFLLTTPRYDVRRTFYASSCENLVEKVRHSPLDEQTDASTHTHTDLLNMAARRLDQHKTQ